MSAGADRTEQATPKRRDEARKKGQVARSQDMNGAVVLLAALAALAATAPLTFGRLQDAMAEGLVLVATPDVVSREGIGALLGEMAKAIGVATAPVALACALAAVVSNVAQVRWNPAPQALTPDPKRINPLQGAKNIFGKNALVEGVKSVAKVGVVGAVVAFALLPDLPELAALVGMPPAQLAGELAHQVLGIGLRAAAAYLVIAAADVVWQRYSHEKGLRMTKEEVKQEMKGQQLPAEVRSAVRRRQMEAARGRMMADVPTADVVVTNPTHFAVALRYDAGNAAPVVVAKGVDLVAAKIRGIAADHGVPLVPDPPLARSLHAGVEVGHAIPEELYQAVAELLAFVFRTANRRRALGSTA